MPEAGTKKLAGKYGTPEELEAAYAALEAKLGEQGQQLGTLQQQLQQASQALTEFGEWTKVAKPIVDWYSTNANDVKTWWDSRGQGAGAGAGNGTARGQATAVAQQTQGFEWLNPQEKEALIQEAAKALQTTAFNPWAQQFQQTAQTFATQLQNQNRAFTNVLWKTLERVMPAEKLAEVQKWHEEALKWADPSKIDPMEAANNMLSLQSERDRFKGQVDELTKKFEDTQKAEMGSLFSDGTQTAADKLPEPPKDRTERFQRVMTDLKQEHGAEGMRTMFGGGNLA